MNIPLKLLYIKKYCPGWFELRSTPVPGLQVWNLALGQGACGRQPKGCVSNLYLSSPPPTPNLFLFLLPPLPFPFLFLPAFPSPLLSLEVSGESVLR